MTSDLHYTPDGRLNILDYDMLVECITKSAGSPSQGPCSSTSDYYDLTLGFGDMDGDQEINANDATMLLNLILADGGMSA